MHGLNAHKFIMKNWTMNYLNGSQNRADVTGGTTQAK